MKRLKFSMSILLTFTMLCIGLIPGAGYVTVNAATPDLSGLHDVTYAEGSAPVQVAPDIQITNGGTYSDGFLKFAVAGGLADETLSLTTVAQADTTAGVVSVVGTAIYLGEGTTARQIGSVNAVSNGKQGKALQIDFSTPLVNGDFEGSSTTPTGWTINNNVVTLGSLATKTQGGTVTSVAYGASSFKVTGSVYDAVYGGNVPYSYYSDLSFNREGKEKPLQSAGTFTSEIVNENGNKVLQLKFSGNVTGTSNTQPFGSVFGPEAISSTFKASAGDTLGFKWKAANGGDDYEVYGFLLNTDTNQYTELMYGRGKNQDWTQSTGTIPVAGNYKFRFVAGSYDHSGGLALGASLYIDDARVYSNVVTDAVIQKIAALATYSKSNTSSLPPGTVRPVTITAQNASGEVKSGTVDVHLEKKLELIKAVVEDTTPDRVKLTFNYDVDGGAALNLTGMRVGGKVIAEVISVVGNVITARLAEPVEAGPFSVSYDDTAPSHVALAGSPNNKLGPISAMNGQYSITPLQLVKVTTDPTDPTRLKLKFNKSVAQSGLDLSGLTVGGKPVTLVGVAGDEVTVSLGEPYAAGSQLAYNATAPSHVEDAKNPGNVLANINAGTIPVISGKLGALELADKNGPIVLTPAFNADVTGGYSGVVPNDVSSISLAPLSLNPGETSLNVTLNGKVIGTTPDDLNNLPLVEGANTITVAAYDKANPDKPLTTYTVVIWRATSKLVSLVPTADNWSAAQTLSPAFDSATLDYAMTVPYGTRDFRLTPTALDPKAKIEISINGGTPIVVNSADLSDILSLQLGQNTIVVKVTGQLDTAPKEYKVVVTRLGNNSSNGGGSGSSGGGGSAPASNTQKIVVDVVVGGDSNTKVEIERTKQDNGKLTDQVTFTPEKAAETAKKAADTGEHVARIVIPDANDEVSEIKVNVPKETLTILQNNKIDLEIQTENGVIQLPYASLEGLNEDFYFRLVPVKDTTLRNEIEERARTEQVVRAIAGNNQIFVVARPMTIETNLTSRPVSLTLPLRDVVLPQDPQKRQAFLNELGIFIEHSDGEKVVVSGKAVTMSNGELGLRFSVNKFSTFTILHMDGLKADGSHTHYINGYADGAFRPNQGATRAEIATMLSNLGAAGTEKVPGAGFTDVADSYWAASTIARVKAAGLMSGYPNGHFEPEGRITRAEMTVIVYNYLKISNLAPTSKYTDVASSHWANGIIGTISDRGLMSGYPNGLFQPEKELSRSEAVTLLNRLFDRGPLNGISQPSWTDVAADHWAYAGIEEASKDHAYKKIPEGEELVHVN